MRIRNERDAWEFLHRCWYDPAFGGDEPLTFDGCALTIRLDPGDGRANWKTTRAVHLLQDHLNRTYLLAKRGKSYGRLSDFERELLDVGPRVEPGSTNVIVELANAASTILKALQPELPTRTKNIIAAGVVVATLSLPFVHEFASYRTVIDKAHIDAAASVQVAEVNGRANAAIAKVQADAQITVAKLNTASSPEVAAAKLDTPNPPDDLSGFDAALILASLARDDDTNVVAFAVSDYVPWRPAFLNLAPYAGTLEWNDSRPIPARAAKAIAKSVRAEATKQRRLAKEQGHPGLITTPWVTEVLDAHGAPGAMRLGASEV